MYVVQGIKNGLINDQQYKIHGDNICIAANGWTINHVVGDKLFCAAKECMALYCIMQVDIRHTHAWLCLDDLIDGTVWQELIMRLNLQSSRMY